MSSNSSTTGTANNPNFVYAWGEAVPRPTPQRPVRFMPSYLVPFRGRTIADLLKYLNEWFEHVEEVKRKLRRGDFIIRRIKASGLKTPHIENIGTDFYRLQDFNISAILHEDGSLIAIEVKSANTQKKLI